MSLVVGLDLGTTNIKAAVVAASGDVIASASREIKMQSPRPGWAEQDAENIWRAVCDVLEESCAGRQVDAVCVSAGMHSVMPVDDEGTPLLAAMTWADVRCESEQQAWTELYARTGCPAHTTYHPARLRWLRKNGPQATRYVSIKDWVIFRLTGRWATDHGYASTTGLLDIHARHWHDEALRVAGVEPERLCPLVKCGAIVGEATGLAISAQVVAGSSDGAMAQIGSGATDARQTIVTVGTSGAIRRIADAPALDEHRRAWCYVLDDTRWLAGGAINNAGLLLKWVRKTFWPDLADAANPYEVMLDAAARISPGADGVIVLPYLSGERCPHYRSDVTASIHGLQLRHDRAHVTRAAVEAIAFCLADVAEHVALTDDVRLTGGITRHRAWMQILADVLGAALQPVDAADASAFGAAMLGHAALGQTVTTAPAGNDPVEPDAGRYATYRQLHELFRSIWSRFHEVQPGL